MFIRLTKNARTVKVFLVLATVALLAPISLVQAQGPPDDGSRVSDLEPFGGAGPTIDDDLLSPAELREAADIAAQSRFYGAEVEIEGGAEPGVEARTGGDTAVSVNANNQDDGDTFGESPLKAVLYGIVVNLFGTLLGWAGQILNWAINDFVIGFGEFFNTTGVGVAVNDLWSLVRDFFNILFIFGFIWIGFQMILNSGNSQAKQTLVTLIMAALLVNFSLFISKFVVDFSNRLASEVAIAAFPAFTAPTSDIDVNTRTQEVNVADTFFAHMGIPETLGADQGLLQNTSAPWIYIFGSAIFYLVAAFVFAAGGIMLVIRFVALSIFMVLSPFMFLGWVFPGMQGWTNKYWKGFLGRAFYAPVYIVLLFFAATIMENFFGSSGSMENDFVFGIHGGEYDSLSSILGAFILSCAFMIAAIQVAGKMSADGAGGVMRVGSNVVRSGQRRLKNGAIGVGRFGARNTAGWAAYGASKASDGVANSRAYRRLNAGLGNSAIGRNVAAGMDASLAAGGRASIAGSRTASEQKKVVRDRQNTVNTTQQQLGRADTVNEQMDIVRANADINDPNQRTARRDAMNATYNQVRRMSDEEVLNLDQELLESPEFAQHLTDSHMKALRESGIYTNDETRGISTARDTGTFDTITETLDSTNASADELNTALDQLAQTVQRMPAERLQGLDVDTILTNPRVASNLNEKQLEDLQSSGRLNATQMTAVRQARTDGLTTIASGGAGSIAAGSRGSIINTGNVAERDNVLRTRRERLLQGSAQTAGQLPPEVFQQAEMAQYITPSSLQQRIKNGVNQSDLTAIEDNLRTYLAGSNSSPREITMWQNWQNGRTTEAARVNIF